MPRRLLIPLLLALAPLATAPGQALTRAHLDWRTLETAHFVVHYPVQYEAWSLDMASRLEPVHEAVTRIVGFTPPRKVTIVVDDPYAVALDLFGDLDMDVCVTWVVARDLLAGGTRRPSGEGDFRVWPSYRRTGEPARLCFSLIGPGGHVTFEADLTDVRHWLDATYALVPSGTEHRMIDWDTLTAHWLDRT